jgi:hypothetical protein
VTCFCAAAWNTTSGAVALEDLAHPRAVAQVGEHRLGVGKGVADDLVEQRLVPVQQQQPAGVVAGNLASDFAADRPAGARDHHGRAFDVLGDLFGVDGGVLPTRGGRRGRGLAGCAAEDR